MQYDVRFGPKKGEGGAFTVLVTTNKREDAEDIAAAVNKADKFEANDMVATVVDVDRDGSEAVKIAEAKAAARAKQPAVSNASSSNDVPQA